MPRLPNGGGSNKRITRRLKQAIELIRTGDAETQKQAAEMVGFDHAYLSRALSKPHVQQYIRSIIKDRNASVMALKGHRLFERVIDGALKDEVNEPSAVAVDVAKQVLRNEGILSPVDGPTGAGGFVFRVELIQAPDGKQAARISASAGAAIEESE